MKNQIEIKCENLNEFFRKFVVLAKPNKPVLEIIRKDRKESLNFQELSARSSKLAGHLIRNENVKIGDKIAILGKNRADWDIAFWGTILAGAIPVLIDPERRVEGVKKHLLQTDAKILIMADDYQDKESRNELRDFASAYNIGLIEMTIYPNPDTQLVKISAKIKSDDTAVILCTSGTTGDPREVELTHRNLISNLQGTLEIVRIGPEDKLGHILPPHHSFGLTVGKLLPLCVGATNIYTNKYHQIYQLIKEREITIFIAVPALFQLLAKRIQKLNWKERIGLKIAWRKLRFCISGSAPLPKWVLEAFWNKGIELREGYGTTENSPVYGFNTNPKKLGSVGKPIPTLLVKITDGEILLGGPCIAKGYFKNPEATQEVFKKDKNGIRWLHTGDLGYLDEDGCLYITGRKKYIIVLPGGKNVNPELVELVLSQAKYIKEILVVPSYDSNGQEYIKAIVFPDFTEIEAETSQTTLKDLIWQSIQECQQKSQELASFERISSKESLEIKSEEFEKTSTGKIKREIYLKSDIR